MTLADGLILLFLLVSTGIGIARGFVREILGLVGLVLGFILAALFAPGLAGSLFGWLPVPFGFFGAYVTILIVTLIVAALLGKLLTAAIDAAKLSIPNRLLGGLFGLARAAAFLLAFFVALDLIGVDLSGPLAGSRFGLPAWETARRVRHRIPGTAQEPFDPTAPKKPVGI